MKHKKRIWQILLLLILVFVIPISSFADNLVQDSNLNNGKEAAAQSTSSQPGASGTSSGNSKSGFRTEWTYRISLEELTNWDFTGYTGDALAERIQEYGEHYYVTCTEEAYYGVLHSSPSTTYRGKQVIYQNAKDYPALNHIMNDLLADPKQAINDAYIQTASDGHRFINPDPAVLDTIVTELEQLGAHNAAMAKKYRDSSKNPAAAAHPVVIVQEVVATTVEGKLYASSAADMCWRNGGEDKYRTLLTTDLKPAADRAASLSLTSTATPNAVDMTIAELVNYGKTSGNPWPEFWTKRFYKTSWYDGKMNPAKSDSSLYASYAWQTHSDRYTGINGCTMIQLGTAIPPATAADNPSGKYTWHIDAEDAIITSSGHKEDQVVKLQGSTSGAISKTNIVGSLNINQDNSYEWENWLIALKATGEKLEISKKDFSI